MYSITSEMQMVSKKTTAGTDSSRFPRMLRSKIERDDVCMKSIALKCYPQNVAPCISPLSFNALESNIKG